MGRIAERGAIGNCHKCGNKAMLDGHGYCVVCLDKLVEEWTPPIYEKPVKDEVWRAKNKVWQKKYYETHKAQCNRRTVECHRRRRLTHPEMLIKDRERQRIIREANRHPCIDCGKPCDKASTRCRPYNYELLRSRENPWRLHRLVLSEAGAKANIIFDSKANIIVGRNK